MYVHILQMPQLPIVYSHSHTYIYTHIQHHIYIYVHTLQMPQLPTYIYNIYINDIFTHMYTYILTPQHINVCAYTTGAAASNSILPYIYIYTHVHYHIYMYVHTLQMPQLPTATHIYIHYYTVHRMYIHYRCLSSQQYTHSHTYVYIYIHHHMYMYVHTLQMPQLPTVYSRICEAEGVPGWVITPAPYL